MQDPSAKGGGGPVLLFSDVHLGVPGSSRQRVDWLIELLRKARSNMSEVFILGDLFDFWFEYRHAIPKGFFGVLRGLADIVDAGIPVTYLSGNHDYWVGSYLRKELGLTVFDKPIKREIQGRRLFLAHGDGMGRGDWGYRFIKQILRNRICISLYRIIHPDLGIPFAHRVSALSRGHTAGREVVIPRLYRDIALPHFREGFDIVVMGHIHMPAHVVGDSDQPQEFLVLGDWLDHFTYMVMENGRVRLMKWNPEGEDRPVPAEPPPSVEVATRS